MRSSAYRCAMLLCDVLEFTEWYPDFSSSEQGSPRWTRVRASGVELLNGLEWVEWDSDDAGPSTVQVELCDACGHAGCASGGYVRLSRLGEHVVWSPPRVDASDDWAVAQYEAPWAVRAHGALLISRSSWGQLRSRNRLVPGFETLPQATRRDVELAWITPIRSDDRDVALTVDSALDSVVAVSEGELEDAKRNARAVAAWFAEEPDAEVHGDLVNQREELWPVFLYVDAGKRDGGVRSWPAFSLQGGKPYPAFGNRLLRISA